MVKVTHFEGVTVGKTQAKFLGMAIPYYLYFVDGLLVDTGPHSLRREIAPYLGGLPIEQVALTHIHEDHCGLASELAARGIPILCPAESLEEAALEPRLPLYRRLFWGRRPPFPAAPLPETLRTPGHTFQVLKGPGHTPHHALFFEPERGWLFSGDFFLAARPRLVFGGENLAATLDTLKRLEALQVRVLFDTHAGPLRDGALKLAQKRAFIEDLGVRVADLRRQGLDDRAIDRRLFPSKPLISFVSRGEWASSHMVRTVPTPAGLPDEPE
jgi:glyoxylase-like metal-dependent hydrolase (beta-lactamase superfamily II)